MKPTGPQRMCAVCRRRAPQASLLRIRMAGDALSSAPQGEGRSVYVCAEPACRAGVWERGRLERGLRRKPTTDAVQAFRRGLESG